MRGFIKTLFGDARNFCAAAICVALAAAVLHSPLGELAGLALPFALLAAAAYLAKH
jgi:membrane protease YdiL (CAAX protease family)